MGDVIDINGSKPRSPQSRRALAAEQVVNKSREEVIEILLALCDDCDEVAHI
jgi:hypothetical protein